MNAPISTDTDTLQRLDMALVQLRRFWGRPDLRERFVQRLSRPVDPTLFRVLRALERLDGQEASVSDVANELDVDVSTASRFLDKAVAAGHLTRTRSEQDARRRVLELTDHGRTILAEANAVRVELMAQLTEGWDPDEVETLANLLDRLLDEVQRRHAQDEEDGALP